MNGKGYWVGFDLGGTKMLSRIYNEQLESQGKSRNKTKGYEGKKAGLDRIAKTIRESMDSASINKDQIKGIGIGCPGPLDLSRGIIHEAPNLGWTDVHVKDYLEDQFKCPVVMLNDVDAGVYGEYCHGAGRNTRTVIGVFPGTGIGGGCVYDGQIIRGKNASCMEIGHVQVAPEGPLCGCGRRGCLEAVASRLVIASQAAAAAYRGQAPHLLETAGSDLKNIRSGALAASVAAGDIAVENIVREAARHIGRAVAGVVNLIGPDVVVLGGGLVEAMPNLFVTEVSTTAKTRALPTLAQSFEVVAAELGDDAGVLGAAAWARNITEGSSKDHG